MRGSIVDVVSHFLEFSLFPQDLTLKNLNCFIIKNLDVKRGLKDLT